MVAMMAINKLLDDVVTKQLRKYLSMGVDESGEECSDVIVKDGNIKVGALVKQANTEVVQFVRYEVGEGIEVEEADFAAEVAAQLAGSE